MDPITLTVVVGLAAFELVGIPVVFLRKRRRDPKRSIPRHHDKARDDIEKAGERYESAIKRTLE